MSKILEGLMYLLWVVAIALILATTFTDFKYEDLNTMALLFLAFSLLNTFFVSTRRK